MRTHATEVDLALFCPCQPPLYRPFYRRSTAVRRSLYCKFQALSEPWSPPFPLPRSVLRYCRRVEQPAGTSHLRAVILLASTSDALAALHRLHEPRWPKLMFMQCSHRQLPFLPSSGQPLTPLRGMPRAGAAFGVRLAGGGSSGGLRSAAAPARTPRAHWGGGVGMRSADVPIAHVPASTAKPLGESRAPMEARKAISSGGASSKCAIGRAAAGAAGSGGGGGRRGGGGAGRAT